MFVMLMNPHRMCVLRAGVEHDADVRQAHGMPAKHDFPRWAVFVFPVGGLCVFVRVLPVSVVSLRYGKHKDMSAAYEGTASRGFSTIAYRSSSSYQQRTGRIKITKHRSCTSLLYLLFIPPLHVVVNRPRSIRFVPGSRRGEVLLLQDSALPPELARI